jgi:next-to-BRCA1 protein 1
LVTVNMASAAPVSPDTPITIKVSVDGNTRRFKLPLRDVGVNVLEPKLRTALSIPADTEALIERYSDSAGAYVVLDQANTSVYKQLYRAAKAKHKLKLRVTIHRNEPEDEKPEPKPASVEDEPEEEKHPSVEPTDTEREPELPVPATAAPAIAEEQASIEPMPQQIATEVAKAKLREMKEMLDETLKEASSPAPSDSPAETSPCAAGYPAMRANYAVCCNSCDRTIPNAHYHCSTCDDGDFDLCQDCVDRGITCKGTNHWLIKRFVKDGIIINSTTERLAPKGKQREQGRQAVNPVSLAPERIIPVFNDFLYSSIRTCNCCVAELPEAEFVHCTSCEDFDLCRACFAKNRHGHHPKHAFVPVVEGAALDPEVARRLAAGRGEAHNALCDGCDKFIKGVRHKCLDCPDWDYCGGCVMSAKYIHPGHRFVPVYEPLEYKGAGVRTAQSAHVGICCDGPLCSSARVNSSYIRGDRFKCAVCHDTDFCAACEASPSNSHNRTHPLIKFKTPVRHVSVTTTGENQNGRQMPPMGDRVPSPVVAEPTPVVEARTPPSLVSNVQTVVDVKPSDSIKVEEKLPEPAKAEKPVAAAEPAPTGELVASYVRDTVQDGTVFGPDHVFEQTWILRNTGKVAWPAGCSVRFVRGDYMGNLDSNHPAATRDVDSSCESTICYATIQPGEEFPFTVLLRTPPRTGRFVSNWRLTTQEGHMFGHRLWCDVVVTKPAEVSPPPPAQQEEKPKLVSLVVEPEASTEVKKVAELAVEPEEEAKPEHSQMIFPKLEKESPVASVYEQAPAAPAAADSVSAQDDEYEDCEDVEWNEGDSEEGFLTDEEYDILDASDEEFHSKQK